MEIHHSWGQEMRRIFLFTFPPLLSFEVFVLLKQAVDISIRIGWRRDFKVKKGNEALYSKAFRVERPTSKPLVHHAQTYHHLLNPRHLEQFSLPPLSECSSRREL
jgi:hypothetical protein